MADTSKPGEIVKTSGIYAVVREGAMGAFDGRPEFTLS
jgi:hypothetical protein